MKKNVLALTACLSLAVFIYSSCSKEETKTVTPATTTLYARVGGTTLVNDPNNPGQMIEKGRQTLRNVVDSSILVIAADPQMAKYFPVLFTEIGVGNTTGFVALSKSFTDFLCSATGSTNSSYAYKGLSMKAAHDPAQNKRMGEKANKADFDKFVGDIGTGLAQNGVTSVNNKQLVDDLVALLYTTQADIVQK